jgi:hypothetical protein
MYDKHKLTYAAAKQIIADGGSVSVGAKVYATLATLPGEADFAKGDAASEQVARESLLRQRAALDLQLAHLEVSPAPKSAKADADAKKLGDEKAAAEKKLADDEAAKKAAEAAAKPAK